MSCGSTNPIEEQIAAATAETERSHNRSNQRAQKKEKILLIFALTSTRTSFGATDPTEEKITAATAQRGRSPSIKSNSTEEIGRN